MSKRNGKINHWKGFVLDVVGGVAARRYYWQAAMALDGKG